MTDQHTNVKMRQVKCKKPKLTIFFLFKTKKLNWWTLVIFIA